MKKYFSKEKLQDLIKLHDFLFQIEDAQQIIFENLDRYDQFPMQEACLTALKQWPLDIEDAPKVRPFLKHEKQELQILAAQLLRPLEGDDLARVRQALKNGNTRVRLEIAQLLLPLEEEDRPPIRALLDHSQIEVRHKAAALLDQEGIARLVEMFLNESENHSQDTLYLLNPRKNQHARDILYENIPRLNTNDEKVLNLLNILPGPDKDEEARQFIYLFDELLSRHRYELVIKVLERIRAYYYPPGARQLLEFLINPPKDQIFQEHPASRKVVLSAVRALENADVKAVETLHKMAMEKPDPELQKALLTTIDIIQSRLGDVDHGRLTIYENNTEGAISLLQDNKEGGLELIDVEKPK